MTIRFTDKQHATFMAAGLLEYAGFSHDLSRLVAGRKASEMVFHPEAWLDGHVIDVIAAALVELRDTRPEAVATALDKLMQDYAPIGEAVSEKMARPTAQYSRIEIAAPYEWKLASLDGENREWVPGPAKDIEK